MTQVRAAASRGPRTAGGPGTRGGAVAGHLLKLARQSLGQSQEGLAERLGQGKNTIQGWESGRRPLRHVRRSDLYRLLQSLRALGAAPEVLGRFDDALEADHFLHEALTAGLTRSSRRPIRWPRSSSSAVSQRCLHGP